MSWWWLPHSRHCSKHQIGFYRQLDVEWQVLIQTSVALPASPVLWDCHMIVMRSILSPSHRSQILYRKTLPIRTQRLPQIPTLRLHSRDWQRGSRRRQAFFLGTYISRNIASIISRNLRMLRMLRIRLPVEMWAMRHHVQ